MSSIKQAGAPNTTAGVPCPEWCAGDSVGGVSEPTDKLHEKTLAAADLLDASGTAGAS